MLLRYKTALSIVAVTVTLGLPSAATAQTCTDPGYSVCNFYCPSSSIWDCEEGIDPETPIVCQINPATGNPERHEHYSGQCYGKVGSGGDCFPCDPHDCFISLGGPECNLGLPNGGPELPNNGYDDDLDGDADEAPYGGEVCCNGLDDNGDGDVDEGCTASSCCEDDKCGACLGDPVSMLSHQMSLEPERITSVAQDLGGSASLTFDINYDSVRAYTANNSDITRFERHLGPGFSHSFDHRLHLDDTINPATVTWVGPTRTTRFFPSGTDAWISERGTNHRLVRNPRGADLPRRRSHGDLTRGSAV